MPLDLVECLCQYSRPCLLTLWNIYFNLADHAFWPCRILSSTQQTMPFDTVEYLFQPSRPCLLALENMCINPANHASWPWRIFVSTQQTMSFGPAEYSCELKDLCLLTSALSTQHDISHGFALYLLQFSRASLLTLKSICCNVAKHACWPCRLFALV